MTARFWIILGMLVVGISQPASAQYFDKTYSIMLDMNKPVSNTNYVDNLSARGFRFGYREMISDKFFGGLDINSTSFNRHIPRRTYSTGTNTITTDLFNYTYNYGATLSFDYLPTTEKKFMPYVSLGVGASYIRFKQFYNVFSNQSDSWGVLVRPEVGMRYRVKATSSWALQAALHYDYSSAKSKDLDLGAFQTVGLSVGVIILDW